MATLGEYLGAGSSITKGLWHLNGNSNDSSGNGNNGTDTSITYSQANGKFGQGAGFSNASNSRVALPNLGISGNTTRTISAWFKATTVSAIRTIFSSGENAKHKIFSLFTGVSAGNIYFLSSGRDWQTGNILSTNTWYNVVLVYNGGNIETAGSIKIYLNGSSQSLTDLGGDNGTLNTSNLNCNIGFDFSTAGRSFEGSIDEVIVENRAWTASEVKKYYTQAKGRFHL